MLWWRASWIDEWKKRCPCPQMVPFSSLNDSPLLRSWSRTVLRRFAEQVHEYLRPWIVY